MAGLQNTWICALDLRLIRADRIVSLLVPVASAYGAASPRDLSSHTVKAIYAEIDGGTEGDAPTQVKLADCGKAPTGELLAGLAHALGSAGEAAAASGDRCMFVFAEQDSSGHVRWVTAANPAAWPQSTSPDGIAAALTKPPLA